MTVDIDCVKEYINRLSQIVEWAESEGSSKINTSCDTYGMSNRFISFGYDGYLDLDNDIEDMIVPPDEEDEEYDDEDDV